MDNLFFFQEPFFTGFAPWALNVPRPLTEAGVMRRCGCSLAELESVLPGPVRFRMTSLEPEGQWVRAIWACGCRAEGPRTADLLLLERCRDHRALLREPAAQ